MSLTNFRVKALSLPLLLMVMASVMVFRADVATAATYNYSNLPLACNVTVPYASTYDQTTVGGVTYYHGQSLDLPAPSGTKVVSPEAGTAYVRYDGGYGNYVEVAGNSGRMHRMAHMQGTGLVPNGTKVIKGQVLGLVGSTGASTGPHLHYEQLVGGSKVAIQLEGPALVWGPRYTSDGDRQTTHGLKSTNCIGSTPAPTTTNKTAVLGWSGSNIVMSETNGSTGKAWNVAVPKISNPALTDSCNFDGDAGTEFISYESNLHQFVMGNPRGDNTLAWSVILKGIYSITDFACLDWNGDGKADIWARDGSNGAVYVGYSNGTKVTSWVRLKATNGTWVKLGNPETLEVCDLNGDGRSEIVAYEANARFMLGRPSGTAVLQWSQLLGGVYNIDATACGNFNPAHAGQELIGWQVLSGKGTFVIGEFASNFKHQRWDKLSPVGLSKPYRGELNAGNIDGDGTSELLSHEYRGGRHYVMVADFTGSRSFRWYQYASRTTFEDMVVGRFG